MNSQLRHTSACLLAMFSLVLMFAPLSAYSQEIPIGGPIFSPETQEDPTEEEGSSSESSLPLPPPPPPPPPPASSSQSSLRSISSASSSSSSKQREKPASSSSESSAKLKKSSSSASSEAPLTVISGSVSLILRPHCEEKNQSSCSQFETLTPTTQQTEPVQTGEILDIDVVALNPNLYPLKNFRAWVVYDPYVFEGVNVAAASDFTTSGEEGFYPDEGYVKIMGTADDQPSESIVPLARIQLKLTEPDESGLSILGFDDQEDDAPHTSVAVASAGKVNAVSPSDLGVLAVNMGSEQDSTVAGPTQTSSASSDGTESLPSDPNQDRTTFVLLQPQNLQITSENDSIYVAWDALPSSDLIGYNVYYSTISGQYIQRRTVSADTTGITLQSMPKDVTYFIAVRGVNASNEETAFSQEVGVKVGLPSSSTSPFRPKSAHQAAPSNPLQAAVLPVTQGVPGASGIPSLAAIALMVSAASGTLLAVRRQRVLAQRLHV